MTNEQKAINIRGYLTSAIMADGKTKGLNLLSERNKRCADLTNIYKLVEMSALEAMKWKDKERKELWRITRNHYQEWAEEQKQQLIDNLREVLSAHMHGGEIDEVLAELDEKMKGE